MVFFGLSNLKRLHKLPSAPNAFFPNYFCLDIKPGKIWKKSIFCDFWGPKFDFAQNRPEISAKIFFRGMATFWVVFSSESAKKSYHPIPTLETHFFGFFGQNLALFEIPWFTKPQRWGAWASACKRQSHFSKLQH